MPHKLAEDQRLVAIFQELRHHFAKELELGAGDAALRHDQAGMAAGLAQLHDFR